MRMTEKDARGVFYQMAQGVHHLHQCGFIHRDIKPEYVFIEVSNVHELSFGVSRVLTFFLCLIMLSILNE